VGRPRTCQESKGKKFGFRLNKRGHSTLYDGRRLIRTMKTEKGRNTTKTPVISKSPGELTVGKFLLGRK